MNGDEDLTRWEIMEHWLDHWQDENGHSPFSCRDLAASMAISTPEATGLIQAYQHEQTRTKSRTQFVIERKGRTRAAIWTVGTRKKDMQRLNRTYFDDIEVNMSGGYDPTQTDPDSALVKAVLATYRGFGYSPQVLPRSPGSWPGYRFTSAPLSLPALGFGLGHGTGAHAPDEYYLIDSANPKVRGLDGAVASFVECLYALA